MERPSSKRTGASVPGKLLSPEEQHAKINETRELIGPVANKLPALFSDASILRYLKARNWNTKKASKMLKGTLKWRLDYKPEKIQWEDIANEAETGKVYKTDYLDKQGRTVLVMRPGFQMVKPFIEAKTFKKVRFIYSKDPQNRQVMEQLFDMDKLESAFGGRNTAAFDYKAYGERMKEDDRKVSDLLPCGTSSPSPKLSVMSEALQQFECLDLELGVEGLDIDDSSSTDDETAPSMSEAVDEKVQSLPPLSSKDGANVNQVATQQSH